MGGGRLLVYAILVVVALAGLDLLFQLPQDSASQDTSVVYCLLPSSRASLVSAAVSLDLAGPGSTPARMRVAGQELTLPQWRQRDDAAFQRACDALAATVMPAPQGGGQGTAGQALLAILLPVIAGALLTMAGDDFKQASDRRFAQGDELRADWAAFAAAARSYAERRADPGEEGIPPQAEVDEKRRKLDASVRKVRAQYRRSPTIRNLRDVITTGMLGPCIADGWARGNDQAKAEERRRQARDINGELDNAERSMEKVATALEHRIWLSSRL
jgi:hypothetical protein